MTHPPSASPSWRDALSDDEKKLVNRARFGRRVGIAGRPALLIIDLQNYMVGRPEGAPDADYPSACVPAGINAVRVLTDFVPALRGLGVPVIYTRFELEPDGSDGGVYLRKRELIDSDGWCLVGSTGAQLVDEVAPQTGDVVLVKKKPSAFVGTPLLQHLIERGVDSVILVGGSTSNCVRATAVDAMSLNLRVTVVEDGVYDRFERSHVTALFDIDRQYGDVRSAIDIVDELAARS